VQQNYGFCATFPISRVLFGDSLFFNGKSEEKNFFLQKFAAGLDTVLC
jgi:hypothetical protein